MDPDACIERLIRALRDNENDEAREAWADYWGWRSRDGFGASPPKLESLVALFMESLEADKLVADLIDQAEQRPPDDTVWLSPTLVADGSDSIEIVRWWRQNHDFCWPCDECGECHHPDHENFCPYELDAKGF